MFAAILDPLQSQAVRIAKHDQDLAQDIISMAYSNYLSALARGKNLTPGELVNFMKYRCGELRSNQRLSFGYPVTRSSEDVYRKSNYLNGRVEILSMDFVKDDGDEVEADQDGHGFYTAATATKDISDNILFEVGLEIFLSRLETWIRKAFLLKLEGYNYREIAGLLKMSCYQVRDHIKRVGRQFIEFFALPSCYLERYGLA